MGKRILAIDDDEAIRKSFILALEGTDYSLDTADCGEQGIQKEKENKYDLIITDLKMPGLNGVETLRELRKIDQNVPIYVATGFHQEFFEQLQKANDDGLKFQVLQKPVSNDQITLLVMSVLESPKKIVEQEEGE